MNAIQPVIQASPAAAGPTNAGQADQAGSGSMQGFANTMQNLNSAQSAQTAAQNGSAAQSSSPQAAAAGTAAAQTAAAASPVSRAPAKSPQSAAKPHRKGAANSVQANDSDGSALPACGNTAPAVAVPTAGLPMIPLNAAAPPAGVSSVAGEDAVPAAAVGAAGAKSAVLEAGGAVVANAEPTSQPAAQSAPQSIPPEAEAAPAAAMTVPVVQAKSTAAVAGAFKSKAPGHMPAPAMPATPDEGDPSDDKGVGDVASVQPPTSAALPAVATAAAAAAVTAAAVTVVATSNMLQSPAAKSTAVTPEASATQDPGAVAAPAASAAAAQPATAAAAAGSAQVAAALATVSADKHTRGNVDDALARGAAVDAATMPQAVGAGDPGTASGAANFKVAAAVDSPDFGQGVANQVSMMVDSNLTNAKLQVNPAALGPIEVRIAVQGDQAQVWLTSHSTATRDALQAGTPKLREMLSSQGFGQVSVDVSQRSFQERTPAAQSYERAIPDAGTSRAVASAAAVRVANGLLDAYA